MNKRVRTIDGITLHDSSYVESVVLAKTLAGETSAEIAKAMGCCVQNVNGIKQRLYCRYGAKNMPNLLRIMLTRGAIRLCLTVTSLTCLVSFTSPMAIASDEGDPFARRLRTRTRHRSGTKRDRSGRSRSVQSMAIENGLYWDEEMSQLIGLEELDPGWEVIWK